MLLHGLKMALFVRGLSQSHDEVGKGGGLVGKGGGLVDKGRV
jgi:hypothetical protein